MLTQYRLSLVQEGGAAPRQEWGYRLYAALLEKAPPDFASAVHEEIVTPVSQFFRADADGAMVWTVNLLGEESEGALSEALETLSAVTLEKDRVRLRVLRRQRVTVSGVDELFALSGEKGGVHRLCFRTSTAFKSRGQYLNLPTSRLIVQSLIKKWNGCLVSCPIEDEDGEGIETIAAGLRCRSFRLRDRVYYLKGNSIPGFVGELTMENHLKGFHREFADAMLYFTAFAGVGIKTGLGMGGVEHL